MAHAEHFHVLVGLCGLYMPDRNEIFETRRDAQTHAREVAQEFRDEGERVSGTARDGYTVGDNYCIEITPCDDAECLRGLDE